MKRLFCFVICSFICLIPLAGKAGSLEDLRKKLGAGQDNGTEPKSKVHSGKRFSIISLNVQKMSGFRYKGHQLTQNKDVYGAKVVLKIKKKQKGEKGYTPELMKVYAYDKNNNLLVVLERYFYRSSKYIENFKDFRVNRTYHLFFDLNYEIRKKAKSYIVVIGTNNEEFVARFRGRGKIEDFDFVEKSHLNLEQ